MLLILRLSAIACDSARGCLALAHGPSRPSCARQVAQNGDDAKLPRRRRLGAARGRGTRLLFFGGWDGSHTCADLLEIDSSPWLGEPLSSSSAAEIRGKRPSGVQRDASGEACRSSGGGELTRGSAPAVGGEYPVLPGGIGFSSSGGGGAMDATVAMERIEARHEEELQRMRGEVARLRMSNELMARELAKVKTVVGGSMPGMDVEALASRKEVEALKMEVARLRRHNAQERESDQATMHAEMEALKRMVHALSLRVSDVTEAGGDAA